LFPFANASVASDVCTKYQEAAKIVNLALQGLVSQCLPGAKVIDICEFGHTVLKTQVEKLYTKKVKGEPVDRGVAFPVCISVNDVVCNHSPLLTEERVSLMLCDFVEDRLES
jgi:methionine aminopeptidase